MPSPKTWVRAVLIIVTAAALLVSWRLFHDSYTLVAAIGGVVEATELMARYRDAPFVPMCSVPGVFYVLLNAGASTLAFYVLTVLAVDFGTDPERANLYRVATASIGAMAVFRSGLFTLRVGESDVAVGACHHRGSCSQTAAFPARIS